MLVSQCVANLKSVKSPYRQKSSPDTTLDGLHPGCEAHSDLIPQAELLEHVVKLSNII